MSFRWSYSRLQWLRAQGAELLWPSRCPACDAFVGQGEGFCDPCQSSLTALEEACPTCAASLAFPGRCSRCLKDPWPMDEVQAALHYGGALATALVRFKNGRRDLLRNLAPLVRAGMSKLAAYEEPVLLVPVPLHSRRLRQRGFNQSWELASAAWADPQLRGRFELAPTLLARTHDGKHMPHESIQARRGRANGAFKVASNARLIGRRVALVDDVLTTGATSCACARALLQGGARSVSLVVIARTL